MVSVPVLVLRIGTTMFGTRLGSFGCRFACEDILFKTMHSIIVKALLVRPKKYGQLVCPALANTLKRSVKVRVMKMKLQDSIQKGQ